MNMVAYSRAVAGLCMALPVFTLLVCKLDVALFACASVCLNCCIMESMHAPPHAIDQLVRTCHVCIAMTGIRYILFATQPWYRVFGMSIAFGIAEAIWHGAHDKRFSLHRSVYLAACETAICTLLVQRDAVGCPLSIVVLFPLRTRVLAHCFRVCAARLMIAAVIIQPLTPFAMAALCTWNRTRAAAHIGPLFASVS